MLLSRPLIVHVQRGQIDLALASIAVLAYRRDYRWTAAVLLALAAFAKIAPVGSTGRCNSSRQSISRGDVAQCLTWS